MIEIHRWLDPQRLQPRGTTTNRRTTRIRTPYDASPCGRVPLDRPAARELPEVLCDGWPSRTREFN